MPGLGRFDRRQWPSVIAPRSAKRVLRPHAWPGTATANRSGCAGLFQACPWHQKCWRHALRPSAQSLTSWAILTETFSHGARSCICQLKPMQRSLDSFVTHHRLCPWCGKTGLKSERLRRRLAGSCKSRRPRLVKLTAGLPTSPTTRTCRDPLQWRPSWLLQCLLCLHLDAADPKPRPPRAASPGHQPKRCARCGRPARAAWGNVPAGPQAGVPLTKALRGLNLGSAALLSRFATGLS